NWSEARIRVTIADPRRTERVAQLLAPLQPLRTAPGVLTLRVTGGSDTVKRLFERVDGENIAARLELLESDPIVVPAPPPPAPPPPARALRAQWERALTTIPGDWSDLLAEVELESSDWFDRTALNMAPLNPRRDGNRLALQFRAARRFGYGASQQMVARCLTR